MASEMSAEERKRILRERRQAKMTGKGTERLNNILSSGLSLKTTVSPLEKPVKLQTEDIPLTSEKSSPTPAVIEHDDPEDIDISALKIASFGSTSAFDSSAPPDIDEIFKSFLGGGATGETAGNTQSPFAGEDPFAMLLKMMAGAGGENNPFGQPNAESDPQDQLNSKVREFRTYQQNKIKLQFLVVRFVSVLTNFFWHYRLGGLQLSSHQYIRGVMMPRTSFFTYFISAELGILAAYYVIQKKSPHFASNDSLIMKIVSFGSTFVPQLNQIRPYVSTFLSYWDIFSILLGDLLLVLVLFGLVSVLGN